MHSKSVNEILWAAGLLLVMFAALTVFRRIRRRTADYQQTAVFKGRLPSWVMQFEAIVFCLLVAAAAVGTLWCLLQLEPGMRRATGVAAIYGVTGAVSISVPVAGLAANLVSWIIPPVRNANLRAMEGLRVNSWSMNRGLLYFALVSVPLGIGLVALSVAAPWR